MSVGPRGRKFITSALLIFFSGSFGSLKAFPLGGPLLFGREREVVLSFVFLESVDALHIETPQDRHESLDNNGFRGNDICPNTLSLQSELTKIRRS
jgi:hypothetical protein